MDHWWLPGTRYTRSSTQPRYRRLAIQTSISARSTYGVIEFIFVIPWGHLMALEQENTLIAVTPNDL